MMKRHAITSDISAVVAAMMKRPAITSASSSSEPCLGRLSGSGKNAVPSWGERGARGEPQGS